MWHNPERPPVKASERYRLIGYRNTLRSALNNLTNPKFNEWWEVGTCYINLQSSISDLTELCLPWSEKRGQYFEDENIDLAIKREERDFFEQFAQLFEMIRNDAPDEERFEFEMVQDPRWRELREVANKLNTIIQMLETERVDSGSTWYSVLVQSEEGYDHSKRSQSFIIVLEKILRLYDKEKYPLWHPSLKVFADQILTYDELVQTYLADDPDQESHYSAFSADDTHVVGIGLEEQDGIIGFSVPDALRHKAEELKESISGLYQEFRCDKDT